MNKLMIAFVVLLAATVAVNVVNANPGLALDVTPVNDKVKPGGTAQYEVSVENIGSQTENVHLSINNSKTGWTYTFSKNDFDLAAGATETLDLDMTVPSDASVGDYYHDVKAEGKIFGITVEETTYTNVVTTVVPEFNTIAIPVLAIFGIMLLMRRR